MFGTELEKCNAVVVSTFRNIIGAGVMLAFIFAVREQRTLLKAIRSDFFALLGLAAVGSILEGTLQIWSLEYTTAARCSMFANTPPIYTIVIAHFVLGEPCTRRNVSA